jgi:hypothetical protein
MRRAGVSGYVLDRVVLVEREVRDGFAYANAVDVLG